LSARATTMAESQLVLITGGSRSGKSSYALNLAAQRLDAPQRGYFLATAQPIDDEMQQRIAHHRRDRPASFETIEEPIEVCRAMARIDARAAVLVIDCLTLWISNLMAAGRGDEAILAEANQLARLLRAAPFHTFVVSDEVGSGIVPMEPLSRRFRDLLGWTNQTIGRAADQILLMVAGHPLRVK
jgi:adenosylcobinamide kinase / adenosylcobinamide-phosphate guanylyltransferase